MDGGDAILQRSLDCGLDHSHRSKMATSTAPLSRDAQHRALFFRGCKGDGYSLIQHLGRGAYGEVWAAREKRGDNKKEGDKVAIKKISNCFVQATEAKRILRELRILRHLSHANVIRIRDVLSTGEAEPASPICGWSSTLSTSTCAS